MSPTYKERKKKQSLFFLIHHFKTNRNYELIKLQVSLLWRLFETVYKTFTHFLPIIFVRIIGCSMYTLRIVLHWEMLSWHSIWNDFQIQMANIARRRRKKRISQLMRKSPHSPCRTPGIAFYYKTTYYICQRIHLSYGWPSTPTCFQWALGEINKFANLVCCHWVQLIPHSIYLLILRKWR